jgi:hypothetical protein
LVGSETLEGLKWIAEQIIKSTEKPIINSNKDFEKKSNYVIESLFDHFEKNNTKIVDMADVGNEIGIAIGKFINNKDNGFDLDSLISGIRHGVSLIDGTH